MGDKHEIVLKFTTNRRLEVKIRSFAYQTDRDTGLKIPTVGKDIGQQVLSSITDGGIICTIIFAGNLERIIKMFNVLSVPPHHLNHVK